MVFHVIRKVLGFATLVAVTVAFASCGSDDGLQDISVRTDYAFNGYNTPYTLALERGFYEDEGLNVTIELGTGSGVTVQTVSSGADDFGIADSGTVALAISNEDVPVKMLSVFLQEVPTGFILRPDMDFEDPSDLKGKVFVGSAGSNEMIYLPALLEDYGLTEDDLEIRLVDFQGRMTTFLSEPTAVLAGFATGDFLRAQAQMPDVVYRSFAEFGIQAYGTGLIANTKMIEDDPDTVRKFLRATLKGWKAALESRSDAVQSGLNAFPDVSEKLLTDGLNLTLDELLHSPATEGRPVGWMAESDWSAMLSLFEELGLIDQALDVDRYYTNEFIPGHG
jgi:NitT/TauT family transport system substrate-binding protein